MPVMVPVPVKLTVTAWPFLFVYVFDAPFERSKMVMLPGPTSKKAE